MRLLKGAGIGAATGLAAAILLITVCTASEGQEKGYVFFGSSCAGMVLIVFGALVGTGVGFFFGKPKGPPSADSNSPPK